MASPISKSRAQKAKKRIKEAKKTSNGDSSWLNRPTTGLLIGALTWLCAVALLKVGQGNELAAAARIFSLTGNAAFLLLALIACGVYLHTVRQSVLHQNSKLLMMMLVSLLTLIPAKFILYLAGNVVDELPLGISFSEVAPFLFPFILAPLLVTILTDGVVGITLGIWVSLVMSIMAGNSFTVFLTGMIATTLTVHVARRVRRRMKVFRIGFMISVVQMLVVVSMAAIGTGMPDPMLVFYQAMACLVSGFFCAFVLLLFLPLFEGLFKITTDITLLELSDLGHKILQRLAIEAPGTYHHSLVVANLAQGAADQIDANSLVARVGSYFHDIGKLTKPDFFAENIRMRTNPHDELAPSMSTLVVSSHVKEGISLAMLNNLPDCIIDIIREHHGTCLISYFHQKAKQQMELVLSATNGKTNGSSLDESSFRYPGPRPRSRESAIIHLADAVEAASRSMEKPTASNIDNLVTEIVNTRLVDGQLDLCSMSLSELTQVRRSFVFTLTNMMHARVAYPKDEDRDKQQSNSSPASEDKNRATGPAPDEVGQQS